MTLEDQIRDEKLQYGINREAAKISALSSGKIDKYEYVTGEEILPSNQQQINEQAKFTYSPLRRAFEKQIKTIEDQGKKQIDALTDLKPKETKPIEVKSYEYGDYFRNELTKIRESSGPIDFNNLIYYYKGNTAPINFIDFKGPLNIFKSIYKGDKTLEEREKEQIEFKRYLGNIKQGNPKKRSEKQQKAIDKLKTFIAQGKKVLKCIMVMLRRCLEIFMNQKKGNRA